MRLQLFFLFEPSVRPDQEPRNGIVHRHQHKRQKHVRDRMLFYKHGRKADQHGVDYYKRLPQRLAFHAFGKSHAYRQKQRHQNVHARVDHRRIVRSVYYRNYKPGKPSAGIRGAQQMPRREQRAEQQRGIHPHQRARGTAQKVFPGSYERVEQTAEYEYEPAYIDIHVIFYVRYLIVERSVYYMARFDSLRVIEHGIPYYFYGPQQQYRAVRPRFQKPREHRYILFHFSAFVSPL